MAHPFNPNWRVHPSETLREIMRDKGVNQSVAATMLGVSTSFLNDFLHGKRGVGQQFAVKLAEAFGPSAGFWMRLQANYDVPITKTEEEHV